MLDLASGKSKRQIEKLVADLAPKADVKSRLTRVAEPRSVVGSNTPNPAAPAMQEAPASAPVVPPSAAIPLVLEAPRPRALSTPLGAGRHKLVVQLGQEGHDHLEQLVELLRHQNPSGDLAKIVERALRELLESEMKRRFGQNKCAKARGTREVAPAAAKRDATCDAPAMQAGPCKSRYNPRNVLREVYARDGGQCTYESADGRRCTARAFLEVHHYDVTFARGGEATAENLRLTCRAHNMFFADLDYGRGFMQKKLREAVARKQIAR